MRRAAGLALGYLALALLAQVIGMKPLHAVLLWPAAGLALAALAVWGWRYWPAIWLGAFAAELLKATPLPLAAWIAVGIALQAVLGALLTRRWLRAAEPLATQRDALAFLVLGGPLACLVAATVGVAGLHFLAGLPTSLLAANWLTWWVGDSLGVLLATPLVLLVLPETRRHWRGRALQVAGPLLIAGALVVVGYGWLIQAERENRLGQLKINAADMQSKIENVLYQRRERLRAIESLFEASEHVTAQQFAAFSRLAVKRSGVETIEWAPRVTQAERAAFEAAARRDGHGNYSLLEFDAGGAIVPAATRADYYPIRFATHSRVNSPLGLDLGASPRQGAALAAAAASTRPAMVAREDFLVRADGNDWRLLIPIYRAGFDASAADAATRGAALRGFAVAVLDPNTLWADVAAHVAAEQIAFRISGLARWNPAKSMLAGTVPAGREARPDWSGHIGGFAGEGLRIEAWSLAPWLPGQATSVRLYFGGGLLLMLLTGVFGFAVAGHGRRLARELALRAASEERLAALVDNVQVGVLVHDLQATIVSVNSTAERLLQNTAARLLGRNVADPAWGFLREDGSRLPAAEQPANRVLSSRQPLKDVVLGIEFPRERRTAWMLVSAAPIFDAQHELAEVVVTFMDITERRRLDLWEHERMGIMEALGNDVPLAVILERITRAVEAEDPRALCSILLLDESGKRLRHGAAPSLPDFYVNAIDGLEIGPEVGSCGTEAFTRQRVIVADIDSHPYWSGFRDLAARAGLRACWSEPVLSAADRVLATFAIYRREPGEPGEEDFNRLKLATALARLAIEQSQAKGEISMMAAMLDAAPMYIVVHGFDGKFFYANDSACRMHQYERAEFMALTLQEMNVPESAALLAAHLREVAEKGGALSVVGHWRKDGSVLPLEVFAKKVEWRGMPAILGIGSDITERNRATAEILQLNAGLEKRVAERTTALEQANAGLHASNARIAAVLDTVVDGIITIDAQGTVETFNPAAEHIFGYAAAEVIGQNVKLLMPEPYHGEHDGYLARYLATGEARVIGIGREVAGRRKDGSVFPLELVVSEMRLGDVRRFVGAIHDITERQQASLAMTLEKERLDLALTASNLAMWDIDVPTNRVFLDQRWSAMIGATAAASVTTVLDLLKLAPAEDHERLFAASADTISGRSAEYHVEHRVRAVTGEWRWVLSRGKVVARDAGGRALRMIGVNADITHLKRTEEALQDTRKAAEAASRAKSDFLATMSHEIRTPMNGVIGMIDVLHQTSLRGYQVEMVDTIRDSAFALLGIIEDILDFSKIEAGKLEIEHEPTDIAEVVEKACAMLDHLAVCKNVNLTLFTHPALPARVLGDAQRLRQIVINLVANAIKFSAGLDQTGRVSVRVVPAVRQAGRSGIEICVTDNGIGMDDAMQGRLFTAFSQADASTTRRFGGTGLGLSIASNLAELMGGDIAVQSTPNQGSTFTLRLPCVAVADSAAPDVKPASTVSSSPVAGLACLVVGGADSLADDWAAYLEAAGVAVERAADLAAAREHAAPEATGPWLWLIDGGDSATAIDEARAIVAAHAAQDLRLIVVGRGKRRRLTHLDAERRLWRFDANLLMRQNLLKALAIASGRLPEDEESTAVGKSVSALAAPTRAEARRAGRLILIAEDNQTNQKVIVQQLALLGFAADVAADGRAALERWRSGDHALLLTDLHMPAMDGFELTAAIRAAENSERRLPIIALTANALKGEALRCLDAGMDDYLSKPTPLAELKAMLEKWLPAPGDAVSPAPTFTVKHGPPSPQPLPRERGGALTPLSPGGRGAGGEGALGVASSAAVDVSVLAALIGDDPATIRDFLLDFRASATSIAAELSAACTTGDTAQAQALAHKLKSSARAVGALALGELCAELEAAGKGGQAAVLSAVWPRFEAEMVAVDAALDELTANRDAPDREART